MSRGFLIYCFVLFKMHLLKNESKTKLFILCSSFERHSTDQPVCGLQNFALISQKNFIKLTFKINIAFWSEKNVENENLKSKFKKKDMVDWNFSILPRLNANETLFLLLRQKHKEMGRKNNHLFSYLTVDLTIFIDLKRIFLLELVISLAFLQIHHRCRARNFEFSRTRPSICRALFGLLKLVNFPFFPSRLTKIMSLYHGFHEKIRIDVRFF